MSLGKIVPIIDADFLANALTSVSGLKSSTAAMEACGMQPELAAHLMLQCHSLGTCIILRAGSPPVYNQKRGPKTGLNLSKTSNQGLFKGSIAEQAVFSRLKDGKGIGLDKKDQHYLNSTVRSPRFQHTVALPVTMQDILRELAPPGDMRVLGYKEGTLRLGYKQGKGDKDFNGQFVINLMQGDETPVFYSRPWDRPDHHPEWDAEKKVINKPQALADLPDELYEQVFGHTFTVGYSQTQTENLTQGVRVAKVFANTPRTSKDLLAAIETTEVLDRKNDAQALLALKTLADYPTMTAILAVLSAEQILRVYDACALVTTGDWDGLALCHPRLGKQQRYAGEITHVYNTFPHPQYPQLEDLEREALLHTTCSFFRLLKKDVAIQCSPLGSLLNMISDPISLISSFALARAGCITPYEFLFQQLINYSYRDQHNSAYGNHPGTKALQAEFAIGLDIIRKNSHSRHTPAQRKSVVEDAVKTVSQAHISGRKNSPLFSDSLKTHLDLASRRGSLTGNFNYKMPHPQHDINVHNLFQHGFDMWNPYGCNMEGAWLMITADGVILYGDTQDQLVNTLLIDNFLDRYVLNISHGAEMQAGWGRVIKKQISLSQEILPQTLEKYELWQKTQQLLSKAAWQYSKELSACPAQHTIAKDEQTSRWPSHEKNTSFFKKQAPLLSKEEPASSAVIEEEHLPLYRV